LKTYDNPIGDGTCTNGQECQLAETY
jgi:hypothetical protein